MTIKSLIALACALTAAAGAHAANQLQASMTLVGPDGTGKPIGVVTITESKSGLPSPFSSTRCWASQAMELLLPDPAECWMR